MFASDASMAAFGGIYDGNGYSIKNGTILAAEQAKALVENKTIHVIPTKNVPQGFAAALEFNPEASAEENKTNMIHALDNVKAGQITYAVRNTSLNGFSIKEGDIIGLDDKKILAKSQSLEDTVLKLIAKMKEEFHCTILMYIVLVIQQKWMN